MRTPLPKANPPRLVTVLRATILRARWILLCVVAQATIREASLERKRLVPYLVLALPVIALFGGVMVSPGEWVASHGEYDAKCYYAPVRAFGYGEIAKGHVPLWNPHTFSGNPFVAGFQSALYYPLNLHYVVLPLALSLNLEIALHVYLIGAFMFAWARDRGLSVVAALLAAMAVQYSGPYFLHVFAGHLAYLDVLAWSPLVFLSVDRVLDTRRISWALVGAWALAMMVLAGHPQGFFCVLVILLPYTCARWCVSRYRARSLALLSILLIAPVFLSAPQLWPGLALTAESVRANGLSFNIASSISFPPENLMTFLAPSCFGDGEYAPYVGRWVHWETCIFMGISTFALAMYALIAGSGRRRYLWATLAGLALVLALGRYTPIFGLLHGTVPGFNAFRAPARHSFPTTLFLALLAGHGFDILRSGARRNRPLAVFIGLAALLALGGAAFLQLGSADSLYVWLGRVFRALNVPNEVRWKVEDISPGAFASHAALVLTIAAFVCVLLAASFAMARPYRWSAYVVAMVGVVELLVFARAYRPTFSLASVRSPELAQLVTSRPVDFRMFDFAEENYPLGIGANDMWGYDSTALMRYVELIACTQGVNVEDAYSEITFTHFHPLYAMFRCQYIIDSRNGGKIVHAFRKTLPRALLLGQYTIAPDKAARLNMLADPAFNPGERVVLESEPNPKPVVGGPTGAVRVTDETTDSFYVDVEAPAPAILLITDSYASNWRARPVGERTQSHYEILPANHTLIGVPLSAGSHRIHFEYDPPSAKWGLRVGILSTAMCVVIWLVALFLGPRRMWVEF